MPIIGHLKARLTSDTKDFEMDMKAASNAAKEFRTETKQTQEQTRSFGSSVQSALKGFSSGVTTATVAAGTFALTWKKAMDLGESGAQVTQTRESFDLLLDTVRAAPDLLNQLEVSSKGTISQMDLMSSTSTLLAGAQGELARNLADSTPQLLEIAKAAQKLNPALGDTTFLYNSLATGIKRASPMILDNLGLTIKIGDANEKYAAQLGKTSQELTAEEAKLALLNATLEAGNVLIQQVGGSTDSATDDFDRLSAAIANTTDNLKAGLAPSLASAAEAANTLLFYNDRYAEFLLQHEAEVRQTAGSYDEYRAEMDRAIQSTGLLTDEYGYLYKIYGPIQGATVDYTKQVVLSSEAEYNAARAGDDRRESIELLEGALGEVAEAEGEATGATDSYRETLGMAEDALKKYNVGEATRLELTRQLKIASGELTEEEIEKEKAIGYVTQQLALGKISMEQYLEVMDRLASGATTAKDIVNELARAISRVKSKNVTIDIRYRINGVYQGPGGAPEISEPGEDAPVIIQGPGPGEEEEIGGRLQHGADFIVPAGYARDSFGPLWVSSGERVKVTPPGESSGDQPLIVNNYNYNERAAAINQALTMGSRLNRIARMGNNG